MSYLTLPELPFLIAGVLCFIVLVLFFLRTRKRITERKAEQKQQQAMKDFLAVAMERNCRFDIYLLDKNLEHVFGQGSCIGVSDGYFTLSLSTSRLLPSYVGVRAHIYFTMNTDGKLLFFDFITKLRRVEQIRGEGISVDFAFPLSVTQNQKRQFLRFMPKPEHLLTPMLWAAEYPGASDAGEVLESLGPDATTAESIKTIQWRRLPATQVNILDFSAGGMLFELHNESSPQRHDLLMCSCDLVDVRDKPPLKLLLIGQFVRVQPSDTDKSDEAKNGSSVLLGVQWRRWAQQKPKEEDIIWRSILPTDGVQPLSSWILRRHTLEHQAENGQNSGV